jgi:putative PIN family toxin of toxin-antitoxin system
MVRAVLDSSVLVSALITPHGTPGAILDAAERRVFTLCLSPEILAETSRVLTRNPKLQARYGYDQTHVAKFCAGLAAWAQIETNLPELRGVVPLDPKDDAIVATAVKAKADYLVTGDRKHLLALETYESIRIVTPRQFRELLTSD